MRVGKCAKNNSHIVELTCCKLGANVVYKLPIFVSRSNSSHP